MSVSAKMSATVLLGDETADERREGMAHGWERYAGSGLAGGAQDLPLAIGLTGEAETPEAEEIAEVGGGKGVAGHQGFTVKIRGCRAVARCSLSHV